MFMPSAEIRTQQETILAELADLSLTLARDLHARALAADDDAKACDLSLAFHRLARSTRQTLALQSRLDRETRQDVARETLRRVQSKRSQIRSAVSPLIWTEYEGDEAEALFEDLEALIADECADEAEFLAAPLETCIARVREALGLPANDADAESEVSDLQRQSSA